MNVKRLLCIGMLTISPVVFGSENGAENGPSHVPASGAPHGNGFELYSENEDENRNNSDSEEEEEDDRESNEVSDVTGKGVVNAVKRGIKKIEGSVCDGVAKVCSPVDKPVSEWIFKKLYGKKKYAYDFNHGVTPVLLAVALTAGACFEGRKAWQEYNKKEKMNKAWFAIHAGVSAACAYAAIRTFWESWNGGTLGEMYSHYFPKKANA